jgi:hypothetical protein
MPVVRRKQNPPQFETYTDYKPYIRMDFRWRCGYCGVHEVNWGGLTHFHIDHFRPKSLSPELINSYFNLYYSCDICNRYKAAQWPDAAQQGRGYRFYDPCADFASRHFRDVGTGRLESLTPCGEYSIKKIRLDRGELRRMRKERRELMQRYRDGLRQLRELRADVATAEEPRRGIVAALISTLEFALAQMRAKYFRPSSPLV